MIKNLKKDIESQFGRTVTYAKDCDQLAEMIFNKTKRKLSAATLRRFFGLLSSKCQPAKFTLDTLSVYIGYDDFSTYQSSKQNNYNDNFDVWDSALKIADSLTSFTITNIANNCLFDFDKTLDRPLINEQIDKFIESDKNITSLIAPSGFGKSVVLAKWYIQKKKSGDIILIAHSQLAFNLFDYKSEQLNHIGLNVSNANSTISYLLANKNQVKGKFILIVDAIDELFYQPSKLKFFYNQLITLSEIEGVQNWLKVLFTCRENTFEKYLNKILCLESLPNYYRLPIYSSSISDANIPLLNYSEVQQLLKQSELQIAFNSLHPNVKEFLRIPLNIGLFNELNLENTANQVTPSVLYQNIFKQKVFQSDFAEEKQDIIWKIIELVSQNNGDYSVNKSELKETFNIHLKTERFYYHAYNELIQHGVIIEEHNPNIYGFTNIKVRFKHLSYYFYLSSLKHIDESKALNIQLFKSVSSNNIDYAVNVISWLYQIAYDKEDFDAVRHIWELDLEIISSFLFRNTIGLCLRTQNNIATKLISEYASNKEAQKHYFTRFVDVNNLCNGYVKQLIEYNKHADSDESELFVNSLLYYEAFLKNDALQCNEQFETIQLLKANDTITAYPKARKFAYTILHEYFIENKEVHLGLDELLNIRFEAYKSDYFQLSEQLLFEITLSLALLLTKQYELLVQFVDKALAIKPYSRLNSYRQFIRDYHILIMQCFSDFSQFKSTKKVNETNIANCTKFLERYIDVKDSFQYAIPICLFLEVYYSDIEHKKSEYRKRALQIAQEANYKFFEKKIIRDNYFSN